MSERAEEIVSIAKRYRNRYLIPNGIYWWDKNHQDYRACEELVKDGRARWLDVKHAGEDGEPGPGIQLIGRDAS